MGFYFIWRYEMFNQYKVYIIAIIITVALLGSNYLTYQYVDRGWQSKWSEANLEGLKSTLETQANELTKQQDLIKKTKENELYATKKQQEINNAYDVLNAEYSLLIETLDNLPSGEENDSTGVDRTLAAQSTNRIVQAELSRWSIQTVKDLSREADELRSSNENCVREYNSVRDIINK
jgi:hypothetical protein